MKEQINTKLLMELMDNIVGTTGVYAKSYTDADGNKTERTDWQDGWNAAFTIISRKFHEAEKQIEDNLIDRKKALLLISNTCYMRDNKLYILLNDTFHFACADSEIVEEEEIEDVIKYFRSYGDDGVLYWVAKKRGYDPDIDIFKESVERVRKQEERN